MSMPKTSLERLVEDYILSNTPSQLYYALRNNSDVISLSKSKDIQELEETYKEITAQEIKSIEDLVAAYAMVVAITCVETVDVRPILARMNLDRLDWGNAILGVFLESRKSPNILYKDVPLIQSSDSLVSSSSTTQSNIELSDLSYKAE